MSGEHDERPGITARQLAYARGCRESRDCYGECVDLAQRQLDGWDGLGEDFRTEIWGRVAVVEAMEG